MSALIDLAVGDYTGQFTPPAGYTPNTQFDIGACEGAKRIQTQGIGQDVRSSEWGDMVVDGIYSTLR